MDRRDGAFRVVPAECLGVEFGDLLDGFGQLSLDFSVTSVTSLCDLCDRNAFAYHKGTKGRHKDHRGEMGTKIKQPV